MIVSTTATTTTVGGPGRQGSGTAQRVLSRGWAHFGAVPLLVGHVASLPYAVSKDANPEPQTAWFVIAALAAAALDAAARAAWLPGAVSIPLKRSGALLCAANCLLASTCLFMVFSQGYPSTSERSSSLGASDFYQNVVSYAEHAYMLVLMAVCRIVAAVTRNEEKGIMRQDNKSRQGWLEPALNGACMAMFVVSCVALLATGGDENLVMNTWVVGAEQWWMHWLLFGILLASYYLWDDTAEEGDDDDDGHGSDDDDALLKRWIDPACRLLAVVVACVAFHVHMMPSSSAAVRQARFNAIDYFSLRRLGSLRDFFTEADGETWWIVLLRGFTVQLWIALVAGRWFAECMQQICERLRRDGVEYAVHHAADVEDLAFALSVASIFAGSYAASPRQLSRSAAAAAPHNFFLLHMLAWQLLSPAALALCFVALHGLAYAVAWLRQQTRPG